MSCLEDIAFNCYREMGKKFGIQDAVSIYDELLSQSGLGRGREDSPYILQNSYCNKWNDFIWLQFQSVGRETIERDRKLIFTLTDKIIDKYITIVLNYIHNHMNIKSNKYSGFEYSIDGETIRIWREES